MTMNPSIKFFLFPSLFLVGIVYFFSSNQVFGAQLFFDAPSSRYAIGDTFVTQILVDTQGKRFNAVEGSLRFSGKELSIVDIRDGNSKINFWISSPREEEDGFIHFSGITPGGFEGDDILLFSVIYEAKSGGVSRPFLGQSVRLYEHDGKGTETVAGISDFQISVLSKYGSDRPQDLDTEPPEDFKVFVVQDEHVFNGKYFLVFSTQDKGTGIDRYEVREGKWSSYKVAESPYLLKNQSLNKSLYVRAIDKSGNIRTVTLEPVNQRATHAWLIIIVLLGLLSVMLVVIIRRLWIYFGK